MANIYTLKYFSPLIPFYLAYNSVVAWTGIWTFSLVIFLYVFVVLVELVLSPNKENVSKMEEEIRKEDPVYDYLLYFYVPLLYHVQW